MSLHSKIQSLKSILMSRDDMNEREASDAIAEARQLVMEGYDPEEVLMDEFGLEADYVFDLLEY